ncbi:OmpH family outer membrane protein [Novosphingobium sp. JCM 18896]|uniref:OmpH family outer membrane protein n=1 Tax=Novosphingobium sp. JCM 18896 TaxID=2989731 RepID=UPI002222F5EE|nr:OmpH family outer membrane protein [Novosphingobium sp. JCM 18896]MCW1428089.1 OmpH family outer membrane protein [Novosphingobium sp. JCM 18896]
MKTILKSVAAAGLMLAAATPAIAQAQAAAGPLVPGLAVADLDGVVANSHAYKTAQSQRPTTYKPQLDQAEARRKAIVAQVTPLVEKFNKDRAAPTPNQAALQTQAQQIQQIQQAGEQELRQILQPVGMSEAYVQEQIADKLDAAVKAAMAKKKISLLLSPQAVTAFNNNGYNISQDIVNELNTLIPSATLVPPAGWEPREVREQRAQQQAAQGQAPAAPATTTTQPSGR